MCQALDVAPSGYYAWCQPEVSDTRKRREEILAVIRQLHQEHRGRYGSPRMKVALEDHDIRCSENTLPKIMQESDIRARERKRFVPRTTDSAHGMKVAENLLQRDFNPLGLNLVWACTLTYIPTAEGWLYLAVVEDLCSRRIVGWSMDASMESRLVVDALEMALQARRPGVGLLAHSARRAKSWANAGVVSERQTVRTITRCITGISCLTNHNLI
jgi:transposase InsO family protein